MSGEIPARQPGESTAWYGRFLAFLAMRPDVRSILGCYKLESARNSATAVPQSWRTASTRFCWLQRAQSFDEAIQAAQGRRIQEEHKAESERRFRLIRRARRTLDRVLLNLGNPQNIMRWSPSDLLRGIAILATLERENPAASGLTAEIESADDYCRKIRISMSTGCMPGFGAGLPEEMQKEEESESDDDR